MAIKSILILAGDFVEDYEAMVPFQMLKMIGYKVDTACPGKKAGESVKTAIHDFTGEQTYSEKQGHNFLITVDFEKIDPKGYDGLVIPGGRAPEYIRLNDKLLQIVKYFAENKKPIAAICHGPQVLAAADVLKGKRCMGYPAIKPDIINAGAEWIEPNETLSNAYTDEWLVSAAAWPGHPDWMRQFLKLLGIKIEP